MSIYTTLIPNLINKWELEAGSLQIHLNGTPGQPIDMDIVIRQSTLDMFIRFLSDFLRDKTPIDVVINRLSDKINSINPTEPAWNFYLQYAAEIIEAIQTAQTEENASSSSSSTSHCEAEEPGSLSLSVDNEEIENITKIQIPGEYTQISVHLHNIMHLFHWDASLEQSFDELYSIAKKILIETKIPLAQNIKEEKFGLNTFHRVLDTLNDAMASFEGMTGSIINKYPAQAMSEISSPSNKFLFYAEAMIKKLSALSREEQTVKEISKFLRVLAKRLNQCNRSLLYLKITPMAVKREEIRVTMLKDSEQNILSSGYQIITNTGIPPKKSPLELVKVTMIANLNVFLTRAQVFAADIVAHNEMTPIVSQAYAMSNIAGGHIPLVGAAVNAILGGVNCLGEMQTAGHYNNLLSAIGRKNLEVAFTKVIDLLTQIYCNEINALNTARLISTVVDTLDVALPTGISLAEKLNQFGQWGNKTILHKSPDSPLQDFANYMAERMTLLFAARHHITIDNTTEYTVEKLVNLILIHFVKPDERVLTQIIKKVGLTNQYFINLEDGQQALTFDQIISRKSGTVIAQTSILNTSASIAPCSTRVSLAPTS